MKNGILPSNKVQPLKHHGKEGREKVLWSSRRRLKIGRRIQVIHQLGGVKLIIDEIQDEIKETADVFTRA
jgi:hypothetical protein